ncbi:tyrosine-type recombinase/integrase [Clostridium sp.]
MQFSTEWLETYVKPLRKISTYNCYKELINKYPQTLRGIPIQNITSYQIEQLLMSNKKNISGTTLQAVYTIINTIMKRAFKLKVIKDNPCKYLERPKMDIFTPDTLDVNEIQLILNSLDLSNNFEYMFCIAFRVTIELGLRRGELAGLEWSNIKQNKNKLNYGEYSIKNIFDEKEYDFIFTWENGSRIHPMYYLNKLKKVLITANINKKIRFYDLRHTNAPLLLSQGIDFKTIQTRLGHKYINTNLNIYSHVNKEMQKNATEKSNDISGGKAVAKNKKTPCIKHSVFNGASKSISRVLY